MREGKNLNLAIGGAYIFVWLKRRAQIVETSKQVYHFGFKKVRH